MAGEWRVVNGYRCAVLQDVKSSGDWLDNNANALDITELYT